jgi:membrane protein
MTLPLSPPPPDTRPLRITALLRAAWTEYEHDRAGYFAVAMIYYALVSLVPLVLLMLSTLGLLLRYSDIAKGAEAQIMLAVQANFGPELRATIEGASSALQEESIIGTSIGLVALLFTASVLLRHLRLSFRAIWKRDPPLVAGSFRAAVWAILVERIIAFAMVLSGGGLLLAALLLIGATQWIYRLLGRVPLVGPTAGWVMPTASSLVLAAATFSMLFKFLPPVSIRWRDIWPAALLCAAVWVVAGELLTLYGVFFGGSPSASGALAALFAVMLWMSVVSKVLFFGAELCKVLARRAAPYGLPTK